MILDEYFNFLKDNFYEDVVKTLQIFAESHISVEISKKAIDRLEDCTNVLSQGEIVELSKIDDFEEEFLGITSEEVHVNLWNPIFSGLVSCIKHGNIDVRSYAFDTFFRYLDNYSNRENFESKRRII